MFADNCLFFYKTSRKATTTIKDILCLALKFQIIYQKKLIVLIGISS